MQKSVYLIRHAQSRFNVSKLNENYIDERDSELTINGINQATHLGKILESIHFDIILISPLRRALQTFYHAKLNCTRYKISYLIREHITDICDLLETEEDIVLESEDVRK